VKFLHLIVDQDQHAKSWTPVSTRVDHEAESAADMPLLETSGLNACRLAEWKNDLANQRGPNPKVAACECFDICFDSAHRLSGHPRIKKSIGPDDQLRTWTGNAYHRRAPELPTAFGRPWAESHSHPESKCRM
jgi:hypothetical protein